MKIKIKKNFLVIPTNSKTKKKKICFYENGDEVYTLNAHIDTIDPDFYAYIDMQRFKGKTLEVTVTPNVPFKFKQANSYSGEYDDCMRPYFHFTPKKGWMNDPNGLVKVGDDYHLFYQYNPASRGWDNMHWGHAKSKDLLHWEELGTAIFPNKFGSAYSGGAVIDKNNVLSLQSGKTPTVALYYTAAGVNATIPVPFTQCMVYSTDNLETFNFYGSNPILPNLIGKNRDPMVVYCEERKDYVMTLWLNDNNYQLLYSSNLKDWCPFQVIELKDESECPNLFPITADDGKRKWVLIGANEIYLVGEFIDGQFVSSQKEKKMFTSQSDGYASQMYTDLPNGRIVRMTWGKWRNFCAKSFCSQMGTPYDLSLKNINGSYFLAYSPIEELKNISTCVANLSDVTVSKEIPLNFNIEKCSAFLSLRGKRQSGTLNLNCFGVDVLVDFENNQISVGGYTHDLSINKEVFDAKIFIDKTSIEFLLDDGKISFMACNNAKCDENLPYIKLTTQTEIFLSSVTLNKIEQTW